MTVTYHSGHSSARINTFAKLLSRWRGSVYKLIYREILAYLVVYTAVSLMYRLLMRESDKKIFDRVAHMCNEYVKRIPVTFLLGFYVSTVVSHWWEQLKSIPWPDRYLVLGMIIRFREMGAAAKKRFPTLSSIAREGFMTDAELEVLEKIDLPHGGKHWVPCQWAQRLIVKAKEEDKLFTSDYYFFKLIEEVNKFMLNLRMLFIYDTVSIPLVYSQTVTIAVLAYFFTLLISSQYLTGEPDLYIPIFTIFELVFYLGWLKVGETLMNPFGEDDDDFEINWFINRHAKVCGLLINDCWTFATDLIDQPETKLVKEIETISDRLIASYNNVNLGFEIDPPDYSIDGTHM